MWLHLPVDTASANRAGHEIWGYNKFVASIDIADSGNNFAMTIGDPDNTMIARFNGTRSASVTMPPNDIVTFSIFEGQLMRTVIQMMTPSQLGSGSGFSLKIGEFDASDGLQPAHARPRYPQSRARAVRRAFSIVAVSGPTGVAI